MAVVKADAYGHGAVRVSRAALEGGADCLGVALPEEGAELRESGIDSSIYVLSEPFPESIPLLLEYDLIPTVYSRNFLIQLSREAQKEEKKVKIHLKVDTGMNRVGVNFKKALPFIEEVLKTPHVALEGVFTHFASADDPSSDFTQVQIERFRGVIEGVRRMKKNVIFHAANSAAAILFPSSHFDMVRVGISIYGLHPSPATQGKISLIPALSWKAKIAYLKEVNRGEGISYGHTFHTEKRSLIATLPLGYADGFNRKLSNRAHVLVKGKRCRVVGTVCMDQFMVDVTDVDRVKEGDEVVIIGRQGKEEITATEMASWLETINYEIVCSISKRVPRVYR
jgi:alanine racemase